MSRKGIAERLQMARRSKERLSYDWWREVYIQDVSELLPQARVLEERERVGETISFAGGKVPEENAGWLFEEGMVWQKQRIKELEAEVQRLREAGTYIRRELWELSLADLRALTDDQRTKDQLEAVEKAWIVLGQALESEGAAREGEEK